MLVLLSPAKSLDYETPLATRKASQPRLLDEAELLIDEMRGKSAGEVAALMGISPDLAEVNVARYAAFSPPFTRRNARPAILAFAGDVYQGMNARERFDERDFSEAQKTVRVLSGLYGVLRPLDLMQPYRLEMGTSLRTERGGSLYDWWGDAIRDLLLADLAESPGAQVIVNCASAEYAKAARLDTVDVPVVSPRFEDADAQGRFRIVSFFAKRARGEFAAWLVQNRVRSSAAFKKFDGAGYRYSPERSTSQQPVFVRGSSTFTNTASDPSDSGRIR